MQLTFKYFKVVTNSVNPKLAAFDCKQGWSCLSSPHPTLARGPFSFHHQNLQFILTSPCPPLSSVVVFWSTTTVLYHGLIKKYWIYLTRSVYLAFNRKNRRYMFFSREFRLTRTCPSSSDILDHQLKVPKIVMCTFCSESYWYICCGTLVQTLYNIQ